MKAHSRVLLAWEHGRNFGHAARLLDLSARFAEQGSDVLWAVPEHELKSPWLKGETAVCVAAPHTIIEPTAKRRAIHSFADILATLGFADPAALERAVKSWLALFDRLAIDRVVLDYAPAAQLAALAAGLPAVQITSGFDAPPPDCPVFGIALRGPMLDRKNKGCVDQIDRAIDAVGRQCGRCRTTSLADVLAYPSRWYDCIAETDPYGPRTDGAYVGPLSRLKTDALARWPDGPMGARKAFVYLRSEFQLTMVLDALTAASCSVICVWPEASEDAARRLRRAGLTLLTTPIDLDPILPTCDLVVTYGAVAIASRAVLLGKPQLLLPIEVDKYLVASRITAVGAGRMLGTGASPAQLRETIDALLDSPPCRLTAEAVARRYAGGFGDLSEKCRAFISPAFDTWRSGAR
jgi:UDP:flavonoid glycosyltransferase YjiC (YdhE family)